MSIIVFSVALLVSLLVGRVDSSQFLAWVATANYAFAIVAIVAFAIATYRSELGLGEGLLFFASLVLLRLIGVALTLVMAASFRTEGAAIMGGASVTFLVALQVLTVVFCLVYRKSFPLGWMWPLAL